SLPGLPVVREEESVKIDYRFGTGPQVLSRQSRCQDSEGHDPRVQGYRAETRPRPVSSTIASRWGKSGGARLTGSHGVSPHVTGGRPRDARTSLIVRTPRCRSAVSCSICCSWLRGVGSSLATNSRPLGS